MWLYQRRDKHDSRLKIVGDTARRRRRRHVISGCTLARDVIGRRCHDDGSARDDVANGPTNGRSQLGAGETQLPKFACWGHQSRPPGLELLIISPFSLTIVP